MAKYKNQKEVIIDKPNSFETYAYLGKEEMGNACKLLNGSGFKVWCYLLSNKAGTNWAISPKDAEYKWGISRGTFEDGIKELKKQGFLDDKAIHIDPKHPIQKKKRNNNEIRNNEGSEEIAKTENIITKSVNKSDENAETREKIHEIQESNNIKNTININNINTNKYPTEEEIKRANSLPVRTYDMDFNFPNSDWRNNVVCINNKYYAINPRRNIWICIYDYGKDKELNNERL